MGRWVRISRNVAANCRKPRVSTEPPPAAGTAGVSRTHAIAGRVNTTHQMAVTTKAAPTAATGPPSPKRAGSRTANVQATNSAPLPT